MCASVKYCPDREQISWKGMINLPILKNVRSSTLGFGYGIWIVCCSHKKAPISEDNIILAIHNSVYEIVLVLNTSPRIFFFVKFRILISWPLLSRPLGFQIVKFLSNSVAALMGCLFDFRIRSFTTHFANCKQSRSPTVNSLDIFHCLGIADFFY